MDILDSAGELHPSKLQQQQQQQWHPGQGHIQGQGHHAQREQVYECTATTTTTRGEGGGYDDATALLGHAQEESESPRKVVLYDRGDTMDELPSSNAGK